MATISAIVFLLGIWPIILVWSLLKGLFNYLASVIKDVGIDFLMKKDDGFTAEETMDFALGILSSLVFSLFEFVRSIGQVFGDAWDWAKYEHPFWAFLIGGIGIAINYYSDD